MVHYLQIVISDASQILAILKAHSPHQVSRLSGFILVARTFDADGTLHTHALKLEDQLPTTTDWLFEDGYRLLQD